MDLLSLAAEEIIKTEMERIQQALRATLVAGARLGTKAFKASGVSPENSWREAARNKHARNTWVRSVIDLAPFREFEPAHIKVHRAEIVRRHPNHHHPDSGIANAIAELLQSGYLVKLEGRGRYAPAINGIRLA